MKRCSHCKEEKQKTDFNANSSRPDGKDVYCIPCRQDYQKKRREELRASWKKGKKKP